MFLYLAAVPTFFLLLPMMFISLLTAIFTTMASSAVLGVRLALGYSGLVMALGRRCFRAVLFPHKEFSAWEKSSADPGARGRGTNSERELAMAVESLKTKVMSRDVGRRRRTNVPVGGMRVDYGTLLRSPKAQEDSFGS